MLMIVNLYFQFFILSGGLYTNKQLISQRLISTVTITPTINMIIGRTTITTIQIIMNIKNIVIIATS